MKKIYFESRKRLKLCGLLYEPAKKTYKAIVMLHGFTGDKSEGGMFDKAADSFYKKGFAVLRFDFSGCGESAEAAISVKWEVEEAKTAIKYMRDKGYKSFGLLGFSMGGLINLKVFEPDIEARVLWAPLTKSKKIPGSYNLWDKLMLMLTGKRVIIKTGRKWKNEMLVSRRLFFEVRNINQKRLGAAINKPVLIIHGDSDTKVPLDFSRSMMEYLPKGSRLEIVKGADHHFKNEEEKKLVRLSTDWFVKNLR